MKKGFTLIELLAVIVILAIIAIIAVPIVLTVIEDTKKSAILRSADFYLDGVKNSVAVATLKNINIPDGTYQVMEDGNICIGELETKVCDGELETKVCDGEILSIEIDGKKPTGGYIKIEKGNIVLVQINISNKNIWTNPESGKLEYIEETEEELPVIVLAPGLYDKNNKLLVSWEELNQFVLKETENEYDFKYLIEEDESDEIIDEYYGEASKLIIGEGVTKIGAYTFKSSQLKEIVIPNTVTSIGEEAFAGSELTSIIIPESVTSIGTYAFFECKNLESITIPSGVEVIGALTFAWCPNLKTVNILGSITSIEMEAFLGCESLTSITLPDSLKIIEEGAFAGSGITSIEIPESVTYIDDFAFEGSSLTSIPNLKNASLGSNVFSSCNNLVEITVGQTEVASDGVFYNCKNLKKVIIEEGTISISDNAFLDCINLTEVVIPSSVTEIGYFEGGEYGRDYYYGPFRGCESLTTIYYKGYAEGEPWGAPNKNVKIETNF